MKPHFPVKCKNTGEVCYNYNEYLNSKHWKRIRSMYGQKYQRKCIHCGKVYRLNLHHITYDNFGNEKLEDLVFLCSDCHHMMHEYMKNNIIVIRKLKRLQKQEARKNCLDSPTKSKKKKIDPSIITFQISPIRRIQLHLNKNFDKTTSPCYLAKINKNYYEIYPDKISLQKKRPKFQASNIEEFKSYDQVVNYLKGFSIKRKTTSIRTKMDTEFSKLPQNLKAYYAVHLPNGYINIFTNWPECEKKVKGVRKADYKKFKTIEDAKDYLESLL